MALWHRIMHQRRQPASVFFYLMAIIVIDCNRVSTAQRDKAIPCSTIAKLCRQGEPQALACLDLVGQCFDVEPKQFENRPSTFAIITVFTLERREWLDNIYAKWGLMYGIHGMAVYSEMHGYDYLPIFFGGQREPLNWNRLRKTIKLLDRYDWIMWMESDQFITNYGVTLESLVSRVPDYAHIILNRDGGGNINSGVAFIRGSDRSRQLLLRILSMKDSDHPMIKAFDHNGVFIVLCKQEPDLLKGPIFLLPAKLMNAYLIGMANRHEPGQVRSCNPGDCRSLYWSTGDFIVHFAGSAAKKAVPRFLELFPPSSWINYTEQLTIKID